MSRHAPIIQDTGWTGVRRPLPDRAQEAARVAAYWTWLTSISIDSGLPRRDGAVEVARTADGHRWVRLLTPADADYEAAAMGHSIGYCWDKYSGLGEIYSLRSPGNVPEATILVSSGTVVHAREHRNARLSPVHQNLLKMFASDMGWLIRMERLPFDITADEQASNTRIRCLRRSDDGTKTFKEIVLRGKPTARTIGAIINLFPGDDNRIPEAWLSEPGWELVSIAEVDLVPTTDLTAEAFLRGLVDACAHQECWNTPSPGPR